MIYHPDINGQARSMPIPFHKGQDIRQPILLNLIRRFDLPRNIFD